MFQPALAESSPTARLRRVGLLVVAVGSLVAGCQVSESRRYIVQSAPQVNSPADSQVAARPGSQVASQVASPANSSPAPQPVAEEPVIENSVTENSVGEEPVGSEPGSLFRAAPVASLAAVPTQPTPTQPTPDQPSRGNLVGGAFPLSTTATVRGQTGGDWTVAAPPGGSQPAGAGNAQVGNQGQPPPTVNRYQTPPPINPLPLAPGGSQPAVGNQAWEPVAPGSPQAPPSPQAMIAPGAMGGQTGVAPGSLGFAPDPMDPLGGLDLPNITASGVYQPRMRVAPVDVYLQEARTGRVILGGSVNSDLGVAGQLIIDERNFDITRVPRGWSDVFSGYAFRGAGQSFRMELMPGNLVERYTVNWTTPNLFGYMPYSLSVGGFLFTRMYRDWIEQRLGGRIGLGYLVTKDLSLGAEIRGESVKVYNPRITGVPALDDVLGDTELYTGRVRLAHDTRDSPFLATEGALLELIYDQAFGTFDFPQSQINYSRYFRIRERVDGMGRHVLANTWRVGFSGSQTPIYENFFAGGFSTLRGFRFRGASPVEGGVQVGGRFMFLGSLEYLFPLTADEMLRGVAFVDYGTIEQNVTFKSESFRVAPGLGLRVAVPALGPAPLAFDFAVPVNKADGDETQVFSFYMGFTR